MTRTIPYNIDREDDGSDSLPPFSLLGETGDISTLLEKFASQCDVSSTSIEDVCPCTPMQVGCFSHTMRQSKDYVYNRTLELGADLRLDLFCAAWEHIVQEMPILRTRILVHQQYGYLQVVVKEAVPWLYQEMRDDDDIWGQDLEVDLGRPLSRYTILTRKGTQKRYFNWKIHHALYDGYFVSRVTSMVNELCRGNRIGPMGQDYKYFARYLLQQDGMDAAEYWTTQLRGYTSGEFPSSTARNRQGLYTSIEQCHPVEWAGRFHGARSAFIYAAWALAISRWTGSDDIIFGTTLSGRNLRLPDSKQVNGPTIATVPLRISLRHDETISAYVARIQTQLTEQTPYIHYGLQNIAKLGKDTEHACQFQTLVVVQAGDSYLTSDAHVGSWTTPPGSDLAQNYNLQLRFILLPDGLKIRGLYDSHAIEPRVMNQILQHFAAILQRLKEHPPGHSAAGIGYPTHEDYRRLQQWNGVVPPRVERCVHELIVERCQAQPEAPAVCAWDGDFTYGELDRLSSALAAHLVELGVGPEGFVPVLFEKSRWTTVAMLGVTKAGGAFVLLDPSHPPARLRGICQAVLANVVVASKLQAPMAAQWVGRVIPVGTDEPVWGSTSRRSGGVSVSPSNALYAVFTSGSTGTPKGAVIPHSAWCTSARSHAQPYALSAASRVFQFSSYAFDASIVEHLTTLVAGGCICVPSDTDRQNQMGIAARQLGVTWAELTPSAARVLQPADVPSLNTLVLVGESITASDIDRWAGRVALMNGYGPSECATVSTICPSLDSASSRNIGHATGCICWVVDPQDHEQLLPIGALGELLVEGPIVGRGYLNDPERTAAAFINPPAWLRKFRATCPGNPGGDRVYKTGDLVQYTGDGSLQYMGRKDTQVKLRGQRLELGEVEHHTRACFPGAQDVVAEVVTPAGEGRPPMLVAFVWAGSKNDHRVHDLLRPATDAFRAAIPVAEARLEGAVPAYMMPAVFLPISAVPLAATGKTDRRRLRERAAALSPAEIESYGAPAGVKRPPGTAAEQRLQELWSQILHLPSDVIGADDSFFRLGGNSISAMQLAGAAREAGLMLAVADVFLHPRLSGQATRLQMSGHDAPRDQEARRPLMPFALLTSDAAQIPGLVQMAADQCQIAPDQIEDIYPCTKAQYLMIPNEPGKVEYAVRMEARMPSSVSQSRLIEAWSATMAAHPMLRSRVVELSPGQFCYAVLTDPIPIDFNPAEREDHYRRGRKIWQRAQPLLRIAVEGDRFLLIMHHLLYDGYCVPLVLRNVERAYQGQPLQVSPYRPFRQALEEDLGVKQQFWIQRFKGWAGAPFPAPKQGVGLPSETRTVDRQMPLHTADFTASTMLHLALALTISWELNKARDIVFGTVAYRRGASVPGVQEIIAPLCATLPTRIELDPESSIQKHLTMVQQDALERVPYELIDSRMLESLGGELATAVRHQTIFAVQPGMDPGSMSLFHDVQMQRQHDGPLSMWNLGCLCFLSPNSVRLCLRISEPTILDEIDWDGFADRFCIAFDAIQRQPELKVDQVFHKMATISL